MLGEEQLSLDGLWTHRIRRELYARSLQRVFGSESSGPNSAVESSHAAVVGDGDATGPTTWGKEEVGFMYDCLRE